MSRPRRGKVTGCGLHCAVKKITEDDINKHIYRKHNICKHPWMAAQALLRLKSIHILRSPPMCMCRWILPRYLTRFACATTALADKESALSTAYGFPRLRLDQPQITHDIWPRISWGNSRLVFVWRSYGVRLAGQHYQSEQRDRKSPPRLRSDTG